MAFDILLRVAASDAHSDDLLHSPRIASLMQEDRNLTTALVMGVLRWQIALDARIARLLARAGQRLAEPVAIALQLGVFQLLYMDRIPPHAAIDESVELCRAAGHPHATGMVNAVLRRIARDRQTAKHGTPDTFERRKPLFELPAAFAGRLGHPAWLVERWVETYGRGAALAICEYDQREPAASSLFAGPVTIADSPGSSLPATTLQIDDGSRLVAELAAAALVCEARRPPSIWDCCAAPGGKTLVLAERLPEASILATDVSAKRLARMEIRVHLSPHEARIQCRVMDAADPERGAPATAALDQAASFDLVLCDAPCSGTGTLARNPEIRHRLRPEEFARQAARQRKILSGAARRLAPGGRVLYSTCSLEPEENEQIVESVLAMDQRLHLVRIEPLLGKLASEGTLTAASAHDLAGTAVRNGCLRTLPGVRPCDGFFAALIERF